MQARAVVKEVTISTPVAATRKVETASNPRNRMKYQEGHPAKRANF